MPVWLEWLPWDISRPAMGIIGVSLLILLLFSSMPIGPVMALIGFLGFAYLVNLNASLSILSSSPYRSASEHALTTIPLFMLMGLLCFHAELSKDIYRTLRNWMGRLPGGLAMSTVGGCAGFAAVSGSSLATAVTMGTIALPEMRRYKYADSMACGAIAAGGSIGILIPPSIAFIIYASLTEESIGRLFIAGVIPGLMEALFYILTIYILCKIKPEMGPPGPSSTFREKIVSLKDTWGIIVLFVLVIGGIYGGIFTPTEAAGVGAFGALLLGFIKRKMDRKKILDSLAEASRNTARHSPSGKRFFDSTPRMREDSGVSSVSARESRKHTTSTSDFSTSPLENSIRQLSSSGQLLRSIPRTRPRSSIFVGLWGERASLKSLATRKSGICT